MSKVTLEDRAAAPPGDGCREFFSACDVPRCLSEPLTEVHRTDDRIERRKPEKMGCACSKLRNVEKA
jgi:hypothetical protein